jgi:hypothetical protein
MTKTMKITDSMRARSAEAALRANPPNLQYTRGMATAAEKLEKDPSYGGRKPAHETEPSK